jgi:hypothetical protein
VNSEDTILMWRTLERACAANHTERARDMAHAIRELPQLREMSIVPESIITLAECAECMAIAWEAGRAFQALRTEEWTADAQSAARHVLPS